MKTTVLFSKDLASSGDFEVIERKGSGHPDTLADSLAEYLSAKYSQYTQKKFGAILHHNFDKVGLFGGSSYVNFGEGYLTKPIRVLLNGRASTRFGNVDIPVDELLIKWTKEFFTNKLYNVDPDKDLRFILELSNQSSPGKTHGEKIIKNATRRFWFEPRGLEDLSELKGPFANDTSLGVGYAPLSELEQFIIKLERFLNSKETKIKFPWMGTDIKILATRIKKDISITMCIPQIASLVGSIESYKKNLEQCREIITTKAKVEKINLVELNINTRDKFDLYELYLTATGSSLESGDEGLVGRGNRITGLISATKPYSMEGSSGKNPVYHIGKLYYLEAQLLAEKIYKTFNVANQIYLGSQSGRRLEDPWINVVLLPETTPKDTVNKIEKFIQQDLSMIHDLTTEIIGGKYSLS